MRGQTSLEYLLVIAAFLSFLLLIVPHMGRVYSAGVFGLDVRNAESFLVSLEGCAGRLSVYGEGSEEILSAKIMTQWEAYCRGNEIFVVVHSSELGKSKELSRELPSGVNFAGGNYAKEINLAIMKRNGKISIKDS